MSETLVAMPAVPRGISQLVTAGEELNRPGGAPRRRLRAAAHAFWAVFVHSTGWPASAQAQADMLAGRLLADGGIDETIDGMDEAEVCEASKALRRLCGEAERIAQAATVR